MIPPTWRSHAATCCAIGALAGVLLAGCARSNPAVSSPTPAPPPSGANDVLLRRPPSVGGTLTLATFQPDLPAVEGGFECTGREAVGQNGLGRQLLGRTAISISAVAPSRADTRATIVLVVDSAGDVVRYAERRGPPIRPAVRPGFESQATAAEVASAAAAVRSTTITLDFARRRATVANRGGGTPEQLVSGPIDVVGSMDKFGRPLDRAARVLAQCARAGLP